MTSKETDEEYKDRIYNDENADIEQMYQLKRIADYLQIISQR